MIDVFLCFELFLNFQNSEHLIYIYIYIYIEREREREREYQYSVVHENLNAGG